MYKIELHCHTSEVSPCGNMTAAEVVERYIEKGYDGLVITDHYNSSIFKSNCIEEDLYNYYAGYRNAIIASKGRIKIYKGAEIKLNDSCNDYLVFGDITNLLRRGKEILDFDIARLYGVIKAENLAIFQAHPNRNHMKLVSCGFLDGLEIYNMHTEHESRNYITVEYASKNGIRGISGSDAHRPVHVARGGILTDILPENENELKDIILNNEYKLIF